MTLSYLFQHEDNIPDYGFPFFNGKPVRVNRDTWYGLTKDDYEKTYTNIGTISLNHQFSDALNLRSAFRYSNVDRDLDRAYQPSPASLPSLADPGLSSPAVTRSRPERHTTEGIWDSQTDLTAQIQHLRLQAHAHYAAWSCPGTRFDNLRYASAGPSYDPEQPK